MAMHSLQGFQILLEDCARPQIIALGDCSESRFLPIVHVRTKQPKKHKTYVHACSRSEFTNC
jgi:hypothetical protein